MDKMLEGLTKKNHDHNRTAMRQSCGKYSQTAFLPVMPVKEFTNIIIIENSKSASSIPEFSEDIYSFFFFPMMSSFSAMSSKHSPWQVKQL